MKLKKLQEIHIAQYREHLSSDLKLSPKTIERKLSSLRKFLGWAKKNELTSLDDFPMTSVSQTLRRPAWPADRDSTQESRLLEIGDLSVFSASNPPPKEDHNLSDDVNRFVNITRWPFAKKLFFHLKYSRPKWYKKYHTIPVVHYLHFAILVIFVSFIAFGLYQQLFGQVPTPFAYPGATTNVTPNRIISFQGRLTDTSGNPIDSATDMRFAIYNSVSATGAAQLWEELRYVDPDGDGIFNILLGQNVAISSTIFSENADLWLGVTIDRDAEADPRQRIATVPYALNAETLQGHPPSASVSANQIPVMTQNGDFYIAQANPRIYSVSGGFKVEGQTLTFETESNGNISIAPDGTGRVLVTSQNTSSNTFDVQNSAITVGSLIYGYAGNDNSGYNLLRLTSGSSEVNRFLVDQSGNTSASGDLIVGAVDTSPNISTTNMRTLTFGNSSTGAIVLAPGATTALTAYSNDVTIADTLSVYGNTIGLNNDADANNLIGIAAAGGVANTDLFWGNDLVCDVSETNCGWATSVSATQYWQENSGVLSPANITDDLLIGLIATPSSTTANYFQIFGTGSTEGDASSSGILTLGTNRTTAIIETERMLPLTLGSSSTGPIQLSPKGTTGLTVAGSGSVGIGTTAPSALLDVVGSTGIRIGGTSTGDLRITKTDATAQTYLLRTESDGSFRIYDETAVGTPTRFFINTDGNVGIGTTGPDSPLDVLSTGGTQLRLSYADGGASTTFNTDTNGDLTINASGTQIIISDALSVYGTTIGLNNDADANNLIGIAAAGGVANTDLFWGNDLVCDVSETNCGWATSATSYWTRVAGNIYPTTVNDTVSATSSAATVATFTASGANAALLLQSGATAADLLILQSTGGTLTDAIDATDETITNALNVGPNTITGTTYTITAGTALSLGEGTPTVAISSSDWGIDTSGNQTNIGTIGMDGDLTITQATPTISMVDTGGDDYTVNVDANAFTIINGSDSRTELSFAGDGSMDIGDNTATKTIDIGGVTNSAADTVSIATNATAADIIAIGNSHTSTTLALTGGDDWSINTAGLAIFGSTLSVYGNTIGLNNDADANNLLGIAAAGGVANTDLFWGNDLVCDVSETNCGWALTNYWQRNSGVVSPVNITDDVLVGQIATPSSATANYFQIFGTGTTAGDATSSGILTLGTNRSTAIIETERMLPLTLGSSSTGPIQLSPKGTTGLTVSGNGYVGIGTTTPDDLLTLGNVGDQQGIHMIGTNAGDIRLHLEQNSVHGYVFLKQTDSNILYLESGNSIKFNTNGSNTQMTIDGGGNVGIGITAPATRLDIDTGSNTTGLRLRGAAETVEISDIYVSSVGTLVIDNTVGTDTGAYIELRPEDNEYGLRLSESDGTGTATFSNFYVVDAAVDYMNIVMNATTATTGLVITDNDYVGIGTLTPDGPLDILSTNPAVSHLKLTYTDGSVYTTFNTDSSGDLTIDGTGTKTIIGDDLQVTGNDIYDSAAVTRLTLGATTIVTATTTRASGILEVYGNTIGLNNDADANNLLGIAAAAGVANTDLFWGNDLVCDVSETNCGWATSTTSYWTRVAGNIYPATVNDTVSATSSAATVATFTQSDSTKIALRAGGSTDATTLNVLGSGNVGIGTTAPSTFVRAEKDQNALTSLSVSNATADTAAWTNVSIEAGNSSGTVGAFSSAYTTLNSAVADSFRIRSNSTASNGLNLVTGMAAQMGFWIGDVEKMRIASDGNVGIGTTAPTEALMITGNASMSGTLTVGQGDTIRPEYGPLILAYKSALNTWTEGITLRDISGNVGIGTTAPATRLDIDTGSNTTGLRLRGTAETVEIADIYVKSAGELILSTANTGDTGASIQVDPEDDEYGFVVVDGNTGSTSYANLYMADATVDYLNIVVNATTATTGLVIDDDNQVGIGITAPTEALMITGNASMSGTLTVGQGDTIRPEYGPLTLAYKSALDTWTAGITLKDISGNVGIGVTDPINKLVLDVNSSSTTLAASNLLNVANSDATTNNMSGILFNQATGNPFGAAIVGVHQDRTAGNRDTDLAFYTMLSNTMTEQVRILNNGNVGIGTTGPDSPLDVLSTGGTQLRLSYADGGASTTFNTDTSGDLTINASGTKTVIADDLQVTGNDIYDSAAATRLTLGATTTITATTTALTGDLSLTTAASNIIVDTTDLTGAEGLQLDYEASDPDSGPAVRWSDGTLANTLGLYVASGLVFQGNTSNQDFRIFTFTGTGAAGTEVIHLDGTANGDTWFNTGGNVGIGITAPASKLDIDTGSNALGLRLRGAVETTEIADIFVGAAGQLVLSTQNQGGDPSPYIEVNAEDDEYGLVIRDSNTGDTDFANLYLNNTTVDYLNIVTGATNATVGLVVDASQQVGIGITNPTEALMISGNASISGILTVGQGDTIRPEYGPLQLAYKSGLNAWTVGIHMNDVNGNIGIGSTDPAANLEIYDADATSLLRLESGAPVDTYYLDVRSFSPSGGVVGYAFDVKNNASTYSNTFVLNQGNVGIGVTAPGAKLDVLADSWISTSNASYYLKMDVNVDATDSINFIGPFADTFFQFNNTNQLTILGDDTGDVSLNGNVGIGTTAPLSAFNVAGTTGITWAGAGNSFGLATVGTGGTTGGSLWVNTASLSTTYHSGFAVDGTYSNPGGVGTSIVNLKAYGVDSAGGYGSALTFSTTSNTTLTEAMRITSGSNVGIGNTAPTEKLMITGNASMSGTLTVGQADTIRPEYGPLQLAYKSALNAWTVGLHMNDINGNVGIGSTVPATTLEVNGTVSVAQGSTYTFVGDTNTNMFRYTTDILGLQANGQAGIYVDGTSGGAEVGILTNAPVRSLHVAGNARITTSVATTDNAYLCTDATGDIEIKTAVCTVSALRYKENINQLSYGLDEINMLNPVFFNYKNFDENNPGGRTKRRIGFIAEEVAQIIPEIVLWDEEGQVDSVDYPYFTSLLTKGIQELDARTKDLSNLVSNIINASEVNVEDKLVSPVIETGLLTANTIQTDLIRPISDEPLQIQNSEFRIQNENEEFKIKDNNNQELLTVNDQGDTTVAGTLTAENIKTEDASISGTLYAQRIVSDEVVTQKLTVVERIQEVIKQIVKEDQTQELFAETSYQASNSGTLSYDQIIALINEANQPDQEYLPSQSFGDIDANSLSLAQNMYVFGQTNLADAFVTGTITQGLTFQITNGNSINVLNGTLYIQNLGGPLDLMAGRITIDSQGNTHFVGNVTIAGNLNVKSIKTDGKDLSIDLSSSSSGGFGSLLVKGNIKNEGNLDTNKLTATEASISGQLIADSLKLSSDLSATNSGLIIAASQTASESGILAPSIKTNGTTGVGILPAGETEVVVFNNNVSNTKLIYLTPTSETLNKVLYVKAKKQKDEDSEGFFVVALDTVIDRDVLFNWWIIN